MTALTIFDGDTGAVVSILNVTSISDAALNAEPRQVLIEGSYPAEQWRLVAGQPVAMPEKPGPWAVFDYATGVWTDPRDPANELAAARASASMSRSDFLLAAIGAGIILPSDAGPAARGEVPPSLAPVFDGLPAEVQLEAVVRWGAATVIERSSPVLAVLAGAMSITDQDLDALFGIPLSAPPAE